MRATFYQHTSYRNRASPRRRAAALALAVALVALMLWLLILMGMLPDRIREPQPKLNSFQLAGPQPAAPHSTAHATRAHGGAPRPRAAIVPPPKPVPPTQPKPPAMIVLSKDAFAASDIGKITSHADDQGEGDAGAGTGKDGGSVYGPGEGPGGARLYDAEWYREPTHAEMAYYLPAGMSAGWATIACRTAPQYHVEDCRQLDESPVGSGLSRALRQAAWQFLVRPPRVGGRQLIGAWVRIRFDFRQVRE